MWACGNVTIFHETIRHQIFFSKEKKNLYEFDPRVFLLFLWKFFLTLRLSRLAFAIIRLEDSRSENVTCNGRFQRINNSRVISRIIIRYRVIYQTPSTPTSLTSKAISISALPCFNASMNSTSHVSSQHVHTSSRDNHIDYHFSIYVH